MSLVERMSRALSLPSKGYSRCMRCRTPWYAAEGHQVHYEPHRSMFPLCEDCWKECDDNERYAHCMSLAFEWHWPAERSLSFEELAYKIREAVFNAEARESSGRAWDSLLGTHRVPL